MGSTSELMTPGSVLHIVTFLGPENRIRSHAFLCLAHAQDKATCWRPHVLPQLSPGPTVETLIQKIHIHKRPSNISVNIFCHDVEKILAAKKMLLTPITWVLKFPGIPQLSNHVCHDVGISYRFASNQGFSPIFTLKTAHFR